MTTITYAEFQTNMPVYLERVFRGKEIIKVKNGSRTFVLLGESFQACGSDNIARFGRLTTQYYGQRTPSRNTSPFKPTLASQ